MWIHWRVYSFSSLLKLHLHIYFSFIKRVTCFCIYHDRPVHWRNHTQKKGIAFAKSYASCIVGTNSPLITSCIRRKNSLLSELRLDSHNISRDMVFSALGELDE